MARCWRYTKLEFPSLIFFWHVLCVILLFLSFSLCFVFVVILSLEPFFAVDVPLIFFCPADYVNDCQPRILLVKVEARLVNVKNTHAYFQPWGQYGVAVSGGVEIMAFTATLGFEEGCTILS